MSKYEIGQQIPVSGIITITDLVHNKNGNPIYNTDRGVVVPELLIERLEMKPLEKVQPEPKQEPVKLYCVKESDVLWVRDALTKGKVYEFDGHCIEYDFGISAHFKDFESWKRGDPNYAACLVPLVSRAAKVGEWVYVTHTDYSSDLKVGDIAKVKRVNAVENVFISKPDGRHPNGLNFGRHEYLVLDGYKPEPEYYSGKVVCVEATNASVTVGKAYTVENGIFTWGNGTRFATKASTIEQLNNWFVAAKFIEFKGE